MLSWNGTDRVIVASALATTGNAQCVTWACEGRRFYSTITADSQQTCEVIGQCSQAPDCLFVRPSSNPRAGRSNCNNQANFC